MRSLFEMRHAQLVKLAEANSLKTILIYSSRSDSRYSVWATGIPCRSSQNYLMMREGSLCFIDVSYRAPELQSNTFLDVISVSEEDQFGGFFSSIFKPGDRVGIVGNCPITHLLGIQLDIVDLTKDIDLMLLAKAPFEIDSISTLARTAHETVIKCWNTISQVPSSTERDLEKAILCEFSALSDGLAFPLSIVSGSRLSASTVGRAKGNLLREENGCLVDFGLIKHGLHCDLTRMFFINPSHISESYQQLKTAIALTIRQLKSETTVKSLIEILKENLSIAKLPVHSLEVADLGHGIGFGLHESPIIGAKNWDSFRLSTGMVFCLEPEIVINGLRIRHEEMVIMTPYGAESVIPITID